jgi:hypothetical protein
MIGTPPYLLLDAIIGKKGAGGGPPPPPSWQIASFSATPNVIEVGTTQTVTLNWTMTNDPDSQSIDNGIGSLLVDVRQRVSGSISGNTTFNLSATKTTPYSASTTVFFQRKRYWFTSASDVTPLTYGTLPVGFSQEFATSKTATKVFDCTGGKYFYYLYPFSFGLATPQLIFNGFPVELDPSNIRLINFTNESGATAQYYLLRSDNVLNSAGISIAFQ